MAIDYGHITEAMYLTSNAYVALQREVVAGTLTEDSIARIIDEAEAAIAKLQVPWTMRNVRQQLRWSLPSASAEDQRRFLGDCRGTVDDSADLETKREAMAKALADRDAARVAGRDLF